MSIAGSPYACALSRTQGHYYQDLQELAGLAGADLPRFVRNLPYSKVFQHFLARDIVTYVCKSCVCVCVFYQRVFCGTPPVRFIDLLPAIGGHTLFDAAAYCPRVGFAARPTMTRSRALDQHCTTRSRSSTT